MHMHHSVALQADVLTRAHIYIYIYIERERERERERENAARFHLDSAQH